MSVALLSARPSLRFLAVLAVMALCLALSLLLARQQPVALTLADYGRYRCTTGGTGQAVFRVLSPTSVGALGLADDLCGLPPVADGFAVVEILWRPREFLGARQIVEERFDLFWSRRHRAEGMVPALEDFYTPVLETPRYSLYWLARGETPRLTPDYLADKRLGLLADPNSQTFYLQPLKALKEAGVRVPDERRVHFDNIRDLYHAFLTGRVDLVTGGERAAAELGDPAIRTRKLADDVSSGIWYLSHSHVDNGIACGLMDLDPMAENFARPSRSAPEAPQCADE